MIRYVTRWALSTGILAVEGEYVEKYFKGINANVFVPAKEAFATLEEAKDAARAMAKKKAKSLAAQAKKLSDPKWEPKVVT